MRPMISLAAAIGLVEAIEAGGSDPERVLSVVGLDRATLSNPDGFIAAGDFAQILEEAARATGDDCFGLHFGQRYHPKDVGPLAYVVLNSPTMAVGLDNVARYLRIYSEAATVSFAIEGKFAYIRHRLRDLGVESVRQQNECASALGLQLIRLMVGSDWAPVEMRFAHKNPGDTAEHIRVFGAPVVFDSPTNAFVIERSLVDRPLPAADERLYPILKRYVERVLEEMPREDRLLASVRQAVGESLKHGEPTLVRVATNAAMSTRTLQRRLKEHGVRFKNLVDDTRRRFALHYLRDPEQTLTEIAYILGYSEVSAFNRAFRRWTGSTPSDYRRSTRPTV